MGDPNTGEIYRGMLRKEGDVPLNEEQAEWLKSLPVRDRMTELQEMARKLQSGEQQPKPFYPPPMETDSGAAREMPRYKCHKEVWALKIAVIVRDGEGENRETDGSAVITPADNGFAPLKVAYDYLRKHNPQVGGYYVRYKDGYESYSPAQAFEEGYTRL